MLFRMNLVLNLYPKAFSTTSFPRRKKPCFGVKNKNLQGEKVFWSLYLLLLNFFLNIWLLLRWPQILVCLSYAEKILEYYDFEMQVTSIFFFTFFCVLKNNDFYLIFIIFMKWWNKTYKTLIKSTATVN